MRRTPRRVALVAIVWATAALVIAASTMPAADVFAQDLPGLVRELGLVPVSPVAPPGFSLPGLDGNRLALSDLAGRPALLYFWASW